MSFVVLWTGHVTPMMNDLDDYHYHDVIVGLVLNTT